MAVNPIKHGDLTDQQIADIGTRIELEASNVDDLSALFDIDTFPENRKDVAYRILVPQPITPSQVSGFQLTEGVAPDNRSVKYATIRKTVRAYGTRYEYTKEAVEDNPDSIVRDCTSELADWEVLMKKYSAAAALSGTNSTIAPVEASSVTDVCATFDKAALILGDTQNAEFWKGTHFLAIVPGAVHTALVKELKTVGDKILNDEAKAKVIDGYIGSYGSFDIMTPKRGNAFLQDSTNYYCYFIGKTERGENPLRMLKKAGALTEVIHSPLGSGVMKNSAGDVVADYNHQKGAVAANMKGFLYYVRDGRFVLKCTIVKTHLTGIPAVDSTVKTTLLTGIGTNTNSTSPAAQ